MGYQLFLAATIFGMMITPLGVALTRATNWLARRLPENSGDLPPDESSFRHVRDHVIVAGYGLNGQNLVKVLKRQNIPFVVIEMNPVTVQAARRGGLPIFYGDITRTAILEHAGLSRARILVVAISDASATRRSVEVAHRVNPGLHIIVRTRYLNEVEPLERLGASEVIPEEFETAIEIFVRVLQNFLLPRSVIEQSVAEIRCDSYEILRRGPAETRPTPALARLLAGVEIEAIQLESESRLVGRTLGEAALRTKTGATLLAARRGGQFIPNPDASFVLQSLDILVVMGTPAQLADATALTRAGTGLSGSRGMLQV
jgi:CPA2 family monovalent cation:H+ antiporter-2